MQEIKVPAGFTVSSYEKEERFVLVFASADNPNAATALRLNLSSDIESCQVLR
jgi:hypothetical protein